MLLTSIALAALISPPATAVPSGTASVAAATKADHGKLAWYEGSFEDALKKAKAENKIIFIDFWTEW